MSYFIAGILPETISKELNKKLKFWKQEGYNARYIPKNKLHLTFAFLADCPESSLKFVIEELSRMDWNAITLNLCGYGWFKDLLFADIQENEYLDELALQIRTILKSNKIYFDPKPFKAHITLARRAAELRDHTGSLNSEKFLLTEIGLFESIQGEYRLIRQFSCRQQEF